MQDTETTTTTFATLDTFINDQWEITKGITTPRFSVIKEVFPNQEFQVLIVLGKYEITDGEINIEISCHIEDANGHIILPNSFEKRLKGDLEKEIGFILMPELPRFSFDTTHEAGEYSIVTRVNDTNSGEKEIKRDKITLNKKSPSQFPESEESLEEWRQDYYLDPKPTELISFYFKSMEEIGINNDANILFYVEALNHSLFLMEDINQLLLKDEISRMERNALIMIAARCNYEQVDLEGFWKDELRVLHEIRNEGVYNPLNQEQITHPSDLDMLWSLFFANGKYENVEKIISTISYTEGTNIEDLESLSDEDKLQYGIGSAAIWSLGAIGKQHALVKVYMIYYLNRPEVTAHVANELRAILTIIDEE